MIIIPNQYHTIRCVHLEKIVKIKICDSQIVILIVMDGAFDRNSSLLPIELSSFCSVEEPIVETLHSVEAVSGMCGTRLT